MAPSEDWKFTPPRTINEVASPHNIQGIMQTGDVPQGGLRSTSSRSCTLQIHGSAEEMVIPIQISTRVVQVKEMIAQRLGIMATDIVFYTKQGVYTRVQKDPEEVRTRVIVKGIRSFNRLNKEYRHPHCIVSCGHHGLRQALWFVQADQPITNFVMFDRRDRIGGTSWLQHANKYSKVQTELGTYHLSYSDKCQPPKGIPPWPSRDQLVEHFEQVSDEWGLTAHMKLGTDVKHLAVRKADPPEQEYVLSIAGPEHRGDEEGTTTVASFLLFPGNLSHPRQETYKGEDVFGGQVTYGIENYANYDEVAGKNVAIVGFGAFAVENIRTCCEHHVRHISLVCRRKNLCMPRMISWWVNSSIFAVPAYDVLAAMEPLYKRFDDDPWKYYAVLSNEARTAVTVSQRARFGIGDIYFLSRIYGMTTVVEGSVKRLSHATMHLDSGQQVGDLSVILKVLGFLPDWEVDRLLVLKELVGFWVNGDYRRGTCSEFPTVNAQRFGGTSLSPGAIGWCYAFMHMLNFPKDFDAVLESRGMMSHRPNAEKNEPGYVLEARSGTNVMILLGGICPALGEVLAKYDENFKRKKQWGTHSLEEVQAYAEKEWYDYCEMFKAGGHDQPFPPYPYSVAQVKAMVQKQDAEGMADMRRRLKMA